jgi:hypothetical protein
MPGIALPLFYLSIFVDALLFPPPLPVGGEGAGIFVFLIPFLIGGAAVLALIPIIFATFLLRQPSQHRNWGIALTVWWSLQSIYLGIGAVSSLSQITAPVGSSNQFLFSWWSLESVAPVLGLVGGVWAVVWHTGSTRMDLARRIVSPAGRVLTGGLVIFFSTGAIPGFAAFFVPAIGLLFCSMLLFFAPRTGRALGVVVLVVCVFVGVLLPGQIQDLGGYPINSYYSFGTAIAALASGAVFASSGAIATLRQKRMPGEGQTQGRMWDPSGKVS